MKRVKNIYNNSYVEQITFLLTQHFCGYEFYTLLENCCPICWKTSYVFSISSWIFQFICYKLDRHKGEYHPKLNLIFTKLINFRSAGDQIYWDYLFVFIWVGKYIYICPLVSYKACKYNAISIYIVYHAKRLGRFGVIRQVI